jgi:hypothetical protein
MDGPAEADAWWWIEKPKFLKLTEEQEKTYLPPPPPPPAQEWEHGVRDEQGGRSNYQCPQCKRWAHRCGSCGWMGWAEETYCSENCWKAAGSPKEKDEHVQS